MAAFPATIGSSATGRQDLSLTGPFSLRGNTLPLATICVPCNKMMERGRKTAIKAMGGGAAKYKGTQMREKKLTEMIEEKVMEAKQVCDGDDQISDECKVAWDEVEEISQAKADLRLKLAKDQDPLESYCEDNPETDECRIYED